MEIIAKFLQPLLRPGINHILASRKEVVFLSSDVCVKTSSFQALKDHPCFELIKNLKQTFSFQNGIGHTDDDFKSLILKINSIAHSNQLIINIHNPTRGTLYDLKGVAMKQMNFTTDKIKAYAEITKDIMHFLDENTSLSSHTHFAHSEAGIIIENVLRQLDETTLEKTKRLAHVITLGSPTPVSSKHVKTALNIYSDEDYLVIPFVKMYSHLPEYSFKSIQSLSNKEQKHLSFIDHSMDGDTYLSVIKRYLDNQELQ